jgi:hypothetical protein
MGRVLFNFMAQTRYPYINATVKRVAVFTLR